MTGNLTAQMSDNNDTNLIKCIDYMHIILYALYCMFIFLFIHTTSTINVIT